MTSIQERMRELSRQFVNAGIDVSYATTAGEAADLIDELVSALEKAESAIQNSYKQADAEWRCHDRTATKCNDSIREWRGLRDSALSKAKGEKT